MVVSPIRVNPKKKKYRLTVNLRYVNRHLGKKIFKFDGLKDLADLSERGDDAVSNDTMSEYYHVGVHPGLGPFLVYFGREATKAA